MEKVIILRDEEEELDDYVIVVSENQFEKAVEVLEDANAEYYDLYFDKEDYGSGKINFLFSMLDKENIKYSCAEKRIVMW